MFYLLLPIHCADGFAINPFEYTHLSDALEAAVGSNWWEISFEAPSGDLVEVFSSDTDGPLIGPIPYLDWEEASYEPTAP